VSESAVVPRKQLTAVVAVTPGGVIGLDGDMPWRLRSDLRRFKKLTMGGVLIMGRRTYDSIGRPLPGRRTIVVTRNADWSAEGVDSAASPAAALELAGESPTYVVGGAQIYQAMLPHCQQIFLTTVWSNVRGDTSLPLDLGDFRVFSQMRLPATPTDDVPSEFFRLVRRNHREKMERPH
jgi:dihydrofolate reductase